MSKLAHGLIGALITATFMSGAGHAQTVSLSGQLLDESYTTVIASPTSTYGQGGANGDYYTSPLLLSATYVGGSQDGAVQSLFGYCIDIYHEINGSFSGLSYQFQVVGNDNDAVQSGYGDPLTPTQVDEIGYLTQQGYNLYISPSPTDLQGQEAGIQDAIWEIEYPGAGFSFAPQQTDSISYASSWYAAAITPANYQSFEGTLYEVSPTGGGVDSTQSFAIATAPLGGLGGGSLPVPEPDAWMVLLMGVGVLGATLRLLRPFRPA